MTSSGITVRDLQGGIVWEGLDSYHAEKISGVPMNIIDLIVCKVTRCNSVGQWEFTMGPHRPGVATIVGSNVSAGTQAGAE